MYSMQLKSQLFSNQNFIFIIDLIYVKLKENKKNKTICTQNLETAFFLFTKNIIILMGFQDRAR